MMKPNSTKLIATFEINRRSYELIRIHHEGAELFSVRWEERGKSKCAGFKVNDELRFERIKGNDPLTALTEEKIIAKMHELLIVVTSKHPNDTLDVYAVKVTRPDLNFEEITEEQVNRVIEKSKRYSRYGIAIVAKTHDYLMVVAESADTIYSYEEAITQHIGYRSDDEDVPFREVGGVFVGLLLSPAKRAELNAAYERRMNQMYAAHHGIDLDECSRCGGGGCPNCSPKDFL